MSFGNAPCRNAEWAWALMLVLACVAGWGLNEGLFQYWSVSAVPVGVHRRREAWAWMLVLACVASWGLNEGLFQRWSVSAVPVGVHRRREAWAWTLVLACVASWGLNEGLFQRWSVSAVPVGVCRRRVAWALALGLACVAGRGLNEGLFQRWSVSAVPVGVRRRRVAWALALVLACVAGRGLNEGLFQCWSVSAGPVGVRRRREAWALALVLACVAARGLVRAQQCQRVAASVAVGTSRNASGHWEAQVVLERRSEAPGRGAGEVRLDVEPSTAICGGARVDTLTLTIRGPPPPPGPGYVSVPGVGYYRIHKENRTWAEAKAICEAEGGHLLIINSEAEDKAIQQLLKQEQKLSTWIFIVFSDIEKEGSYFTIFGDPLSALGYARWNPGQPDDYKNSEDCGSVHSATGDLNDLPCNAKVGFICEQRLV